MACSYPITIRDKIKGTDINPKFILVPCGRCIDCIERKRADWSFRLLQELKISNKATFLTLTYNDENVPFDIRKVYKDDGKDYRGHLDKKGLQNYFKRVRSEEAALRYYAVGEYGTNTNRPHYHAIVYNVDNSILVDKWSTNRNGNREVLGFSSCDTVTEASIHYVTGYITSKYGKIDDKTGKSIETFSQSDIRPFALMSKGIGKIYLKHATKYHKRNFTLESIKEGGQKQLLPRYYRGKIFTDEEMKKLVYEQREKIFEENHFIDMETGEIQSVVDYLKEMDRRSYKKLMVKHQLKNKSL